MNQAYYRTIDNDISVEVGQKVWLYPANKKHGGSIKECIVTKVEPWRFYLDNKRYYNINHKYHIYSTKEAAEKQQNIDKDEHPWRRRGRFHILATSTLISYLSFRSNIAKENINASKTESGWLHVAWVNGKGMQKAKLRIGNYYNLTEDILNPIINKMTEIK